MDQLRPLQWVFVSLALAAAVQAAPEPQQIQQLLLPEGFSISLWAEVPAARSITSAKVNGATIAYVGSGNGSVYAVVDKNSDGMPDFITQLLSGLKTPTGVALRGNQLFVSGLAGGKGVIWRLDKVHSYALKNQTYTGTKTIVTDKLPGVEQHSKRFIRFSPQGLLVVGIGAPCNFCTLETTAQGVQFGSIYAVNVTTGRLQQIAAGVRNSVGFDWHPDTKVMYFTDNGRDQMGDDSPDCELNRLPNATLTSSKPPSFGFPYCQTQGLGNPYLRDLGSGVPLADPDLNAGGKVVNCQAPNAYYQPVQAMGPHTAPLGMRFYRWTSTPGAFPKSYNNTMFIVQRGSWNRAKKIGYRVMMLRLDPATGMPTLYKRFVWGWLQNEDTASQFSWGRPVDVEQLPDGSLLISNDDPSGVLYRVTYKDLAAELAADSAADLPLDDTAAASSAGGFLHCLWLQLLCAVTTVVTMYVSGLVAL